jgi:transposase InsO family protein
LELALRLHRDNPLWGAGRIRGELLKLGYRISQNQILRYLNKFGSRPSPPSSTWRTFLRNHLHEAVSADTFVVITATYHFLYGFAILGLKRRKILHFEVTEHPTQAWISNQVSKALECKPRPRFFLRDKDAVYGGTFSRRLKRMGVENVIAKSHSAWHNNFIESWISHLRRECLDHVIIFNEGHLRRVLAAYVQYYNKSRTHEALGGDCPDHRPIQQKYEGRKIVAIPQVGGLHHRYVRQRAA